MTKPDFIIIGAPKSGTTSIYHYLHQHPQIWMPALKEPSYFLFDGASPPVFGGPKDAIRLRELIQTWDRYQALFKQKPEGKITGEASVRYMYSEQACAAINLRLPDAKIIAILRHPADRAYSAYQRDRIHGIEVCENFSDALADGPRRQAEHWQIGAFEQLGCYARYLAPYVKTFGPERLRVYLFDDLVANPRGLVRDLFEYLNVDPSFEPDLSKRFNETGMISNPLMRFLWRGTRSARSYLLPIIPLSLRGSMFQLMAGLPVQKSAKQPFEPALRAELTERYRQDILQLQDLIGRDLSHWLAPLE
jgi:hypothetical protein